MEMQIIRDKIQDLVIVDPFYRRANHLGNAVDRQVCD
jgi:hypothetical protein